MDQHKTKFLHRVFFLPMLLSATFEPKNKALKIHLKRIVKKILELDIPAHYLPLGIYRILHQIGSFYFGVYIFTKKVLWVSPLFRSLSRQVGSGLQIECLPFIQGKGDIVIGKQVRISGKIDILFAGKDKPALYIGNNTFIGHGCFFGLRAGISVGKNCLVAGQVFIVDNDGHPLNDQRRAQGDGPNPDQIKPVVIGDRVWIGRGAMILKGVHIGDGAIIGAGSIVRKNVHPYEIVSGNPAQHIGVTAGRS